jgi:hypothetical protein
LAADRALRALSTDPGVVALTRPVTATFKIELLKALRGMEPRLTEEPRIHPASWDIPDVATSEQGWRTTIAPGDTMPARELACILLTVSSLDVPGVAATLSAHLAAAGIGCNLITVSGRDHLFVLNDQGSAALAILRAITQSTERALADAEKRFPWPRRAAKA